MSYVPFSTCFIYKSWRTDDRHMSVAKDPYFGFFCGFYFYSIKKNLQIGLDFMKLRKICVLYFRSHLEKALKDSQEQVTDLRKRLQEVKFNILVCLKFEQILTKPSR